MDPVHFDRFARSLSTAGSRRRVLRVLAALPLAGVLAALFATETDAAGRHKRRKTRNKRQAGDDKDNRTGERKGDEKGTDKCLPESILLTCAGRCSLVTDRCGGQVDCGSCSCGACPVCQTCNGATGLCGPNAAVVGGACGKPGQVCQVDGSCSCRGADCPACTTCNLASGECVSDPAQNEACCGVVNGGTLCEAGACVAATATVQECGGRCTTPDLAAAFTGPCGPVACPTCDQCAVQTGCADHARLRDNAEQDPPAGDSVYCVERPNPSVIIPCPCNPATSSFCSSLSGGSLNGQCVRICSS